MSEPSRVQTMVGPLLGIGQKGSRSNPPAAIIPMHTPDEAIAELEFVTRQLGSKVGMFGSNMARKVPAAAANDPDTARFAVWYDVLGLDSEYDYDPVWAKCVELGIAPTFHSASLNQGLRLSPTNFTYSHIGHFAAADARRASRPGQLQA